MIVPDACAPPAHIEIRAVEASRRSSSCSAVVSRRVPVEPTGCPRAIAPPLTLIFSSGTPVHRRPRHDDGGERLVDLEEVDVVDRHPGVLEQPLGRLDRAVEVVVGVGADQAGRHDPSARASARARRRARRPSAAAPTTPSEIWDDVPAVWVPPSSTAGGRPAPRAWCRGGLGRESTSRVSPVGLPESSSTGASTAKISRAKRPSSTAARAFCCEASRRRRPTPG